jgi:hypothetical protein
MAAALWLLEITLDGRPLRFGSLPAIVDLEAGGAAQFREGLNDLAFEVAADIGSGEISIAVQIDAEALASGLLERGAVRAGSWAALIAALHNVEGSAAALYRWQPGQTLEAARVMLRGFAEEIEYGGPDEPLIFTLRRSLFANARPILAAQARIDSATWPLSVFATRDSKVDGAAYPRVYGLPGIDGGYSGTLGIRVGVGACPAPMGQYFATGGVNYGPHYAVVADQPIEADQIRICDYSFDVPICKDAPVQTIADGLGRAISVVDLWDAFPVPDPGREYYLGFSATMAGGTPNATKSAALRGAGEIMRALLLESGAVDAVEVDPRLDRYLIDTWINEPGVTAWEWISRELAPLIPFRLVESRAGLALRFWDWQATAADSIWSFDADAGQVDRASSFRRAPASDLANRIIVQYRPERTTSAFLELVGVDATTDETDPRIVADTRCKESRQRLTRPGADTALRETVIKAAHVWDTTTARLIAAMKAAELALPHGRVVYRAPAGFEQKIDPADVVTVNDTEIGLLQRVALVDGVTVAAGETLIALVVLDNPLIDERATL